LINKVKVNIPLNYAATQIVLTTAQFLHNRLMTSL